MRLKSLKYTGMFAVATLQLCVGVGMIRSGLGLFDSRPLSFIGVSSDSALLFNGALFASALLFMLFGVYLFANLKLSRAFLAVFLLGQIAQVVAAIFVYEGRFKLIHTIAAFTLAIAIPLYMKLFNMSLPSGAFRNTSARFFQFEKWFFVVGIGAFIFIEGVAPIAEILPALPFHGWIIFLTLNVQSGRA